MAIALRSPLSPAILCCTQILHGIGIKARDTFKRPAANDLEEVHMPRVANHHAGHTFYEGIRRKKYSIGKGTP
jgi:hypothetical protein